MSKDSFDDLVTTDFITTRMMIAVLILVEVIIQSFSLIVKPTEWMTWQLLGFITATNLGAVLLAIQAQRQADRLGKIYTTIFTPEFYRTMNTISSLDGLVREEASKDGKTMDEELHDLAPKIYGLARKYIDVRAAEAGVTPPEVEVLPAPDNLTEADLFKD